MEQFDSGNIGPVSVKEKTSPTNGPTECLPEVEFPGLDTTESAPEGECLDNDTTELVSGVECSVSQLPPPPHHYNDGIVYPFIGLYLFPKVRQVLLFT